MIKTLSLCPTCYKKIEAFIDIKNGMAVMTKECDVHGPFSAIVERSAQHVSDFYRIETLGNNNTIIIHANNTCNMSCSWCYYPMGQETMYTFPYYDSVLGMYKRQRFNLLLSGGEPTLRSDYFQFIREAHANGWQAASITNMIKLADDEFFSQTMNPDFIQNNLYKFAMSMQHPKNYSKEILDQKMKALGSIEQKGLRAMCVMFSITSLDELEWIREFYNHTKHCYIMLRIRTMFQNWGNKGKSNHIWLSDLHKKYLDVFGDLTPVQCRQIEVSNMYCLYLQQSDGMHVSLSSSPTVENVDYHQCSRPVYMLALDGRCYPVPLAQIINEGIDLGWKDGYKLGGK